MRFVTRFIPALTTLATAMAAGACSSEARLPSANRSPPDDPTFTAADLRLEDESDEPRIEIYVDGDNLVSAGGTSELVLRVLGLSITVNGRTQLGPDDNAGAGQPSGSVEFEMGVALGRRWRGHADTVEWNGGAGDRGDGDQPRRRHPDP